MDYEVRDRGKILGQFSIQEIEHMLDAHKIGMMAEANDGGSWVTLEELMEKIDSEREEHSHQLRLKQDEAEKKASQARQQKELELEIEKQRTQQQKLAYDKDEQASSSSSHSYANLAPPNQKPKSKGTVIWGYLCVGLVLLLVFTNLVLFFWFVPSRAFGGLDEKSAVFLVIRISWISQILLALASLILGVVNICLKEGARSHGIIQTALISIYIMSQIILLIIGMSVPF